MRIVAEGVAASVEGEGAVLLIVLLKLMAGKHRLGEVEGLRRLGLTEWTVGGSGGGGW
jgi:hypothetical protein